MTTAPAFFFDMNGLNGHLITRMCESGRAVTRLFRLDAASAADTLSGMPSTYGFRVRQSQARVRGASNRGGFARVSGDDAYPVAANDRVRPVSELVAELRDQGMPVSGIAEMARVERKTIYSWIDGTGVMPSADNTGRMVRLHGLFAGEEPGSLRFVHRLWSRELPTGDNLRSLLTMASIDSVAVQDALLVLRPAVVRAMHNHAFKNPVAVRSTSEAASLSEYLEATLP